MLAAYIGLFPLLFMALSGMCFLTDHGPAFGYVIGGSSTQVYTQRPHNAANSVLCSTELGLLWQVRLPSAHRKSGGMGNGGLSDAIETPVTGQFLLFHSPNDSPPSNQR
jgi:hypothetical protein